MLVPALGSDERLWQPVVEQLQEAVDCVVIRGEGASIAAMSDDILARAPGEFYLAGISMGGYVCLDLALRRTGRLRGVALLNTSAIAAPPSRRENSLKLIEMADAGDFDRAVQVISAAVAPRRPDVTALAATMARDLGPRVFRDQQTAVLNRADRTEELARVDVPAIVIVGDADPITPRTLGEDLAAGLPHAELTVLDGVGHLSTLEDPAGVVTALRSWLARLDGQPAS
ncbi:alpha/beta fold hydrolase [Blastococcus sp. SYSU D00820]